MIELLAVLVVFVLIIGTRRKRRGHGTGTAWQPQRMLIYIICLAALLAVLYATASLLALIVMIATQPASVLPGLDEIRNQVALALAALLVGLPAWLVCWTAARRRIAAAPDEQQSIERRFFLATIFVTTSFVALFAVQRVLEVLLTLPDQTGYSPATLDGIQAGARLIVYGGAWLIFARIGWRERSPRADDEAHDLAVYGLVGLALSFFINGAYQAIAQLVRQAIGASQATVFFEPTASVWTTWGPLIAWLLSGRFTWAAIWRYDLARGGIRLLRVLYLYLVLAAAVPAALGGGISMLYELLRRLYGYHPVEGEWVFLQNVLPALLTGSLVWAYHWWEMRRSVAPAEDTAHVPGSIPWPRRPAIALLTLLGLAITTPGVVSLLWLAVDFLLHTGATVTGPGWWIDRLSIGLAASVIGMAVWLMGWMRLQGAAIADPLHERNARERRLLLTAVLIASALPALGFMVAALWLVLRMVLGMPHDPETLASTLQYLETALVTGTLAAYHGMILQSDVQHGPAQRQVQVTALLAPGAEGLLGQLRIRTGPAH